MWRNYFTVGIRALVKNRTYAFINIFGLAIGIAACLILFVYVRYETSYDQSVPGHERIYQVQATWHEPGQPINASQRSPLPIRDTIAGGFPQVEAVTIAQPGEASFLKEGQPLLLDALVVDPAFLDIFQLPFVRGSAGSALPNVRSVVLTESEALRQFGSLDVIGRTVTETSEGQREDYTVTAILADLPGNTHLRFDALFRFDPSDYPDGIAIGRNWGQMNQFHYVRLRPGADPAAINAAFPAWERRMMPPEPGQTRSRADIVDFRLTPLADVHLGDAQQGAMSPGNDRRTVATFSIVAALILFMACINFINLSTARAGQRAREVALRKVLGASRKQLIGQFLGESMLVALISMLIALTMVELALPRLAAALDADLHLSYLGQGGFLPHVIALTLLVGAVGGLYPAFVLSRFQPASVLKANKGSAETQGSGRLRGLLVVAQFAVSIGLIVCTWVVYSQTRYVQTADPGYEREGLIQVDGAWRLQELGNYDEVRRQIAAVPGVANVARTNIGIAATNRSIQRVLMPGAPDGLGMGVYRTDADFFPTMGMRLLSGRGFADRYANDRVVRAEGEGQPSPLLERGLNVVLNRRAARLLGIADPAAALGRQIQVGMDGNDMIPSTIVGVVEDTRIRTARDEIEPLVFTYDPERTTRLIIRYRSDNPAEVLQAVNGVWSRFLADAPFEGALAEDLIAELYQRERARGAVFAGFSLLAVIISCLGLFGLAAFTAERRTKEIGIRKVLGATVRHIVQLLAWQFSKPVVIANLIAWPVAWWVMRDWLNTFDARIGLGPTPFVAAGLLALAIAIGTIAGHAIKVARANPIHALRYE
jgi:putative ABC transport system permease protein